MKTTTTTTQERRAVSWRVRQDLRRALRIAVATDNTTCEEVVNRLLADYLADRGLVEAPTQPAA